MQWRWGRIALVSLQLKLKFENPNISLACTHYNQNAGTDKLWLEYADWAIQGVHRFVHNYAQDMGQYYISFTPIEIKIEIEILIFHYKTLDEIMFAIGSLNSSS